VHYSDGILCVNWQICELAMDESSESLWKNQKAVENFAKWQVPY